MGTESTTGLARLQRAALLGILGAALLAGCDGNNAKIPDAQPQPGTVTITGTVAEGSILSAVVEDPNGVPLDIDYQWFADGVAIDGETNSTLLLTPALVGSIISVEVTYRDTDRFVENNTTAVEAAVPAVNDGGSVAIEGEAEVEQTLTAVITEPDGLSGPVTYQWKRDGADIAGATMSTYTLVLADLDAVITVSVTYTDDQGFDEAFTSDGTDPVEPVPVPIAGTVTITGPTSVGGILMANVTDANGTTTSVIAYQWFADGVAIPGATESTYMLTNDELGKNMTVSATYTDDDDFPEDLLSDPTASVDDGAVNNEGSVAITGTLLVNETLTANVNDPDGTTAVDYQWAADGVDIPGATNGTFTLTTDERGAIMSVTAEYTDNRGFDEGPHADAVTDVVYSFIVTNETELVTAVAAASEGDVIGLASASDGDFADMDELEFDVNGLQVRRTEGSTAVISGNTCLEFSGDDIVVNGLVFDALDFIVGTACDSNGDSSIFLAGDRIAFQHNSILNEAEPRLVASGDPYHFISLRGVDSTIERNLFSGKDMDNEGGVITIFANATANADQGHTIQYNLFKDIPGKSGDAGNRDSTAYAIQVGRTTGSDSRGDGLNTIQFNRFDSVQSERRLMRVQSGGNVVHGNTIVDSLGAIAFEDGYANTASSNIILSAGDDSDDSGISFAPLGHTVVDNYINNLRTTSSQRAGLLFNPDPLSGSGNGGLIATPPGDFTVTLARNTVINARQAIQFEDADCNLLAFLVDADDNFILNQSSGTSINGNTNGSGRDAITDDDWEDDNCLFDAASDWDNNRFYSTNLSTSGMFDFNGKLADNTVGGQDGATIELNADGLASPTGVDAGSGADTSQLFLIQEADVGPGSTWVAP